MKDPVAELDYWRKDLSEIYNHNHAEELPTEANAMRQLIYCVITDFLESQLDNAEGSEHAERFIASLEEPNSRETDRLVNEWIDSTYGKAEYANPVTALP